MKKEPEIGTLHRVPLPDKVYGPKLFTPADMESKDRVNGLFLGRDEGGFPLFLVQGIVLTSDDRVFDPKHESPLIEFGEKQWFKNDKPHRDGDEPAVIYADGSKWWYKNGKQHRDGDEPAVILADGSKFWYKNGKLIRGK